MSEKRLLEVDSWVRFPLPPAGKIVEASIKKRSGWLRRDLELNNVGNWVSPWTGEVVVVLSGDEVWWRPQQDVPR